MLTVDQAFRDGLELARRAGLPLKSSDIPVIVARGKWDRWCIGKTEDPRWESQAAEGAKMLIIRMCAIDSEYKCPHPH
jgi:hypothetical protein